MAEGTKEDPWQLKTPPGTSSYTMYSDKAADPPTLVCQVGSTTLKYQLPSGVPSHYGRREVRQQRLPAGPIAVTPLTG